MKLCLKKIASRRSRIRIVSVLLAVVLLCDLFTIAVSSISYYTIRINYCYADGTPAHDPYIATYEASADPLNLEIKNPKITGYDPMTATDQTGVLAETSTIDLEHVDHNVELTVYYLAGLSTYRVMYYKQNIYDDLYTRDNTISSEYTNRRGKTGTNPTILETEELPGYKGFTNLFHEPDSIAADDSTVFRVYYDRKYYHVLFDLGSGGYGVEPVYAKYQSVYHISDPKRPGYTFIGWARTDKDSTQSDDWHYIDSNGNEITEEQAKNSATNFSEGTVPANNIYYKAIWEPGVAKFSVVYWIENPASELTEADYEGAADDDARTLLSQNYSVAAIKDVYEYANGTPVAANDRVDGETVIKNAQGQSMQLKDFFSYNLNYADPNEPRNDPDNPCRRLIKIRKARG